MELFAIVRAVDRLDEMAPRFKLLVFMFMPARAPVVVLGKVAIPELDAAAPPVPATVLLTQLVAVYHAAVEVFELKVPFCEKTEGINAREKNKATA